jgi:hypothetical protein
VPQFGLVGFGESGGWKDRYEVTIFLDTSTNRRKAFVRWASELVELVSALP